MNLADAASSAILLPAQRREIEIAFAQALDLSSDRRREYANADELFRKCLALDGSNVLVVTAYLENLARWRGRKAEGSWLGWLGRLAFSTRRFPSVQARHAAALALLSRAPVNDRLKLLSKIAREQQWELAEEAYLLEMLSRDSDDSAAAVRVAEILIGKADFYGAERYWRKAPDTMKLPKEIIECVLAVREPLPDDYEAMTPQPETTKALITAKQLVAKNQFMMAVAMLSRAANASGHSLALREAREDVQLAQLQFQFDALAKLEQEGNALAAKARVSLQQKLMRLRQDIVGARADRFPDDWSLRLELVEQLIRVGNYFEALRRLNDPPAPQGVFSARALRLKAETQQRLKRFDAAMSLYRELLEAPAFAELSLEEQQRVRAQSQRLSDAMGSAKTDQ